MRCALLVVALAGCADDPPRPDPADAGPDAADEDGGAVGFEPAPPEPPRLTPCPDGWREVADADDSSVVWCDPWPPSGRATCAGDEAHFPGSAGCERIGTACPAGDWPEDLPFGPTAYVRPGAVGGDGTQGSPYGTIAEALAARRSGVIALGRFTYDEHDLVTDAPVTVWGACVSETRIAPSVTPGDSVLRFGAADGVAQIRNLTVVGGSVVVGAGTLEATDVVVQGPSQGGLAARGTATLRASRVATKGADLAISAVDASRLEIDRAVVSGAREVAIEVYGTATMVAADLAVLDTEQRSDAVYWGMGIVISANAEIRRSVFESSTFSGVNARGGHVVLEDVLVRDTRHQRLGAGAGYGLELWGDSVVEADRVALVGNSRIGLYLFVPEQGGDTPPTLAARDLVVVDTQADGIGQLGTGILVTDGGDLHVERAAILRNRFMSVAVDEASTIDGTDVSIRATRSVEAYDDIGYGLYASRGAGVDLLRAVVDESHWAGVLVSVPQTTVTLEELLVTRTLPRECADCEGEGGGFGISCSNGGAADVRRFRVSDHALCGVQVAGGSLDLAEGEISRNPIGANVQGGFDVGRILDRVDYLDNGTNLDASALPVPETLGSL